MHECNPMYDKFKDKAHLIDKILRMTIKKIKLSASAIKYYYGCNNYGERDKINNEGTLVDECPRCSETEAWEHVMQCRKKVSMRTEFILKLYDDLKQVKINGVQHTE